MSLDVLEEYAEPNLPPEVLLDPYNPANDRYYQAKADLERRVVAATELLSSKQVRAVKLHHTGMSNKDIAKTLKCHPQTVSRYLKNPKATRLRSLLAHYQQLLDGPNEDHRVAVLWRIVVDNEQGKPSVAVSAMQEINKMRGSYEQRDHGDTTIQVIVSHNVLARSALDG